MPASRRIAVIVALVVVVSTALWQLRRDAAGLQRETAHAGSTPVTVYRMAGADPAPAILVAHGFAGSQRLMEPFALALAGNGYVVVTYDFLGHGRNPLPLRGELGEQEGTPALLIQQTREVADFALDLPDVDGRMAVLGHSMATNILVRFAQEDERVAATVGVSMYAPTVDEASPRNLLAIVGALEGRLEAEGRRVVALVDGIPADLVEAFTTYGGFADGSARRLVVSPGVEHVGVLYSGTSFHEARSWMDSVFHLQSRDPLEGRARGRGLWIALLMGAVFFLARPLAHWLPRVREASGGADAPWGRILLVAGVPALTTPLLLRPLPTGFLPVVVGDYVAVHFGTFGLLSAGLLWWTGGRPGVARILDRSGLRGMGAPRALLGAGLLVGYFLLLVAWPIDRFFTSFFPVAERLPLMLAVLAGTLPYFLADEWLTRGAGARRGAYPFSKLLFLLSLALAVALDFQALFFLIIIVPVIVIFFLVHGLLSRWAFQGTGSPLVAGLGNAVAFAWALGVTFPLYAGGG